MRCLELQKNGCVVTPIVSGKRTSGKSWPVEPVLEIPVLEKPVLEKPVLAEPVLEKLYERVPPSSCWRDTSDLRVGKQAYWCRTYLLIAVLI
jgi:hypothetical protein